MGCQTLVNKDQRYDNDNGLFESSSHIPGVSKCRTVFYLSDLSLDCNHFHLSPSSYSRVNRPSDTSSPSGTLVNLNLSKPIYLHLSILNTIVSILDTSYYVHCLLDSYV